MRYVWHLAHRVYWQEDFVIYETDTKGYALGLVGLHRLTDSKSKYWIARTL